MTGGGSAFLSPEPSGHFTTDADPELIRDAHLFLLDRIGRSMGLAFHPQPLLEPPTYERIVVLGRFDPEARQREFGLELGVEEARHVRIARLIDLYLPESHCGQRFGTRLMRNLVDLWGQVGVSEVLLAATADGLPAYESWGFVADDTHEPDFGLHPMRLKFD